MCLSLHPRDMWVVFLSLHQLLAVVNNAVMSTGIWVCVFVLWGTYLEVKLPDHNHCVSRFEELQDCFPHSCTVFIHTSHAQGFQVVYILTNTLQIFLSLMISSVEHLFICLQAACIYSSGEISWVLCSFSSWVLLSSRSYSWCQSLTQIHGLQIFSPIP